MQLPIFITLTGRKDARDEGPVEVNLLQLTHFSIYKNNSYIGTILYLNGDSTLVVDESMALVKDLIESAIKNAQKTNY